MNLGDFVLITQASLRASYALNDVAVQGALRRRQSPVNKAGIPETLIGDAHHAFLTLFILNNPAALDLPLHKLPLWLLQEDRIMAENTPEDRMVVLELAKHLYDKTRIKVSSR